MSAKLDGVGASARRKDRVARVAWMANHSWWVAALCVSVQTGLLYSEFCDDAYANGDNGPFGNQAHQDRFYLILVLLLLGLVGAIMLSITFHNRNKRALSVANVAIGTVGGSYALIDAVTQSDSNPYCRVSGIWFPVTVASIILTVAVLVNSRILRSPSPA